MRRFLNIALAAALLPVFSATGEEPMPESLFSHLHTKNGRDAGSLQEWMAKRKVPGVSIAVIRDFKVDWTYTVGVRDVESKEAVDPDTLFQAASISKPVAAAAVHRLAEMGKLNLDAPIGNYLTSWQIPSYDFPNAPAISARLLMSHRAGVSVHGFDGCEAGAPLPTVVQILNGEPPANSMPVLVERAPGEVFEYSGGGITMLQCAVMDITQRPAGDVVKDLVLEPSGMTRSSFTQPISDAMKSNYAVAYKGDGTMIKGGGNTQPELFAAGLWTTPGDLCRFAVSIQNALRSEGETPFSKETAIDMTTPTAGGPTSPGFFMDENYFWHGGSNVGMRCILKAHKTAGYGFALMTNSDNGQALQFFVFNALADAYGWEK